MNQQESKALWQTIRSVFEVLAVNAIIVALLLTLGWTVNVQNVAYPVASVFGLTQLTYVIPRGNYLYRRKRWPRFKGVVIGATIAAFLNGGCWVFGYWLMSNTQKP